MRTRTPTKIGLARGFALSAIVVALAACSEDGQELLEAQPGAAHARDAGGGAEGDAATADGSVPIAEPEFGWRSDWFDLFADRKASRVDAAIGITRPMGIRETLYS